MDPEMTTALFDITTSYTGTSFLASLSCLSLQELGAKKQEISASLNSHERFVRLLTATTLYGQVS
jgi:hypothetical protein